MLIKKEEANKFENSKNCVVFEYPFPSKKMSFAIAHINGRYPNSGKVSNTQCEEIYFVISGSGTIHSEKGNFEIKEGDVYFFETGEKYYTQGNNLKLALVNAPKWFLEQHKEIE